MVLNHSIFQSLGQLAVVRRTASGSVLTSRLPTTQTSSHNSTPVISHFYFEVRIRIADKLLRESLDADIRIADIRTAGVDETCFRIRSTPRSAIRKYFWMNYFYFQKSESYFRIRSTPGSQDRSRSRPLRRAAPDFCFRNTYRADCHFDMPKFRQAILAAAHARTCCTVCAQRIVCAVVANNVRSVLANC